MKVYSYLLHSCKEGPLEVKAATLKHRIASFGFVIQEDDQPGKFDVTAAKALGLEPGPLFGKLQHGETVTAPDGSVVHPYMVLGPSKPGRKLGQYDQFFLFTLTSLKYCN